ncbi:hypothetical protein, partial [Burkholderia gladioli]|uniref:hypothetical protein n=1 Tax=Burkholderia gladioli TaxID=28095 RepID=UPI001641A840
EAIEFMASLVAALQPHAEPPSPSSSSLHVPPLPDSSDSSLRRPASSASGTSGRLPPPRTRLTSSQRPSLQIETEDVPEREG